MKTEPPSNSGLPFGAVEVVFGGADLRAQPSDHLDKRLALFQTEEGLTEGLGRILEGMGQKESKD